MPAVLPAISPRTPRSTDPFKERHIPMRALGLLVLAFAAQAASAQENPTSFRGFRVEANAGGDRFQSQGRHTDKFGYGGTIGFDGTLYDRFVLGAEGTYWKANKFSQNCSSGINGGQVCTKSFQEYGTAIRAGYLITPKILLFGKGGVVYNEQRKSFNATNSLYYINGQIVGPERSYYQHTSWHGWQAGGGAEYSLTDMFYGDVQYVYANYDGHTARQRVMAGVGVRFK